MKAKASNSTPVDCSTHCDKCEKRRDLCVCSSIQPKTTRTKILILQHPQEPDKILGSARLANLILPSSKLKIGLSWPKLEKAWGEPTNREDWVVLYLGSSRPPNSAEKSDARLILVDKKGKPISKDHSFINQVKGIIVLDGTWSQAKTLWWRNAWLSKMKRCILQAPRPSLYGRLRKEPRKESLSTIETIAYSLSIIENNPEHLEHILAPFRHLLKSYSKKS